MNHRVPDFREMEEDCVIPSSSGFSRPNKPSTDEEEIMELLWQNGQVVVQKSANKSPFVGGSGSGDAAEQAVVREIRGSGAEEGQHLFMHEDEMASWLHYPLDDSSFARDLCADDLFYSAPLTAAAPPRSVAEIGPTPLPPRPPIPPPAQRPGISPRLQNFRHFSRLPSRPRIEPSVTTARESTVVERNDTPAVWPGSRVSHSAEDSRREVHTASGTAAAAAAAGGELAALPCELTLTSSSPGVSGASFSASAEPTPPYQKAEPSEAVGDRKRKAREADDNECQSEDMEFEAGDQAKKQARGTRKSRAAEVHNQSERRRRDRINEKMKALQELIPRCNKSDKASMLDEAIEYMKSLQMQLQMMSMGCGMVPMVYPAMQQHFMPAMVMGMGVNRPMMPYPSMLPGSSAIQNPAAMGPRFSMAVPGFHLPQVPLHDHSGIQASNQTSPMLNPHDPNQPRVQNPIDPYQQLLGFHQAQLPLPQNQAGVQPTAEPSTSKEVGNPKNKQSGRK